MTVSTPAERVSPVGPLRTARVGSSRQLVGANLSALAALGILVLAISAPMRVLDDATLLYTKPSALGQEGYSLGLLFLVGAILALLAAPKRADPIRLNGSWARAKASVRDYRRQVRSELPGRVLYKENWYLPSVIASVVVWIGMAVAYYVVFRDVWSDPEVTTEPAAWVAVGALGAGVVGALLMWPGRSQELVRVDEEGRLFHDVGDAQGPLQGPVPLPTGSARTAPGAPAGRGRLVTGLVVGFLVTVVVAVGILGVAAYMAGEARSPSEVADLFPAARVTCQDFEVINDERSSKTLGCRAEGATIISITTYGNRPSSSEWLADWCTASVGEPARLRQGYYLVGEDFVIDIHQLRHPDFIKVTPLKRTATRLATALDATATAYDCNKG